MKIHGQCADCLPKAWDYPPRGGTRLTCGCWQPYPHSAYEVLEFWDYGESGTLVEFGGWCACPPCAIRIKVSGAHIDTWVPDEHREAA